MRGVIYDLQMKRLSKTTWNSYSKRDQKNVWTDSKVRGEEDQEELKKKKSLGKFYRDKKFFFFDPDNSGLENKWNQDNNQANRHVKGEAGRMVVSQNLTLVISWVELATLEVVVVRMY